MQRLMRRMEVSHKVWAEPHPGELEEVSLPRAAVCWQGSGQDQSQLVIPQNHKI